MSKIIHILLKMNNKTQINNKDIYVPGTYTQTLGAI